MCGWTVINFEVVVYQWTTHTHKKKKSSENIFICVDTFTLFASLKSLSLSLSLCWTVYFLLWKSCLAIWERRKTSSSLWSCPMLSWPEYSVGAQVVITSRQLLLLLLLLYSINKQRCDALISILKHGQTRQMYIYSSASVRVHPSAFLWDALIINLLFFSLFLYSNRILLLFGYKEEEKENSETFVQGGCALFCCLRECGRNCQAGHEQLTSSENV